MWGPRGGDDEEVIAVGVHDDILAGNDAGARSNRERFVAQGVLALNLMGSPGSGKTALLEATARVLGRRHRIAALAGDVETDRDATRLRTAGIPALCINTGSACHLDADMVRRALRRPPWHAVDLLFIENAGNLVCPAVYDLGQTLNIVTLAVTEGTDKPLKYPVMFGRADLVVLTKIDLLSHLRGVSISAFRESVGRVMPRPVLLPLSVETGEGLHGWTQWVERRLATAMLRKTTRRSLRNTTGQVQA
jgi:hydrogenase nickel incorporation protein HypB